jgi:LysM repeat protein
MAGLQSGVLSSSAFTGAALQHVTAVSRQQTRLIPSADIKVRPYTVRKGDTLASIAQKREVPLEQLLKLNHNTSPDALTEGQTLLLPSGRLSARDKEILEGIGPWTYRTYPVRAGETLNDIISKRKITHAEMEALNPGVDLDRLTPNQILKLPAGKYTVREQEMLSSFAPQEFFSNVTHMSKGTVVASAALLGAAIFIWRQKNDEY